MHGRMATLSTGVQRLWTTASYSRTDKVPALANLSAGCGDE